METNNMGIKDDWKKIPNFVYGIALLVVVFAAGMGAGYARRGPVDTGRYEARIELLEKLNSDLQAANSGQQLVNREISRSLTVVQGRLDESIARLGKAKEILGGVGSELEDSGDAVQRLIDYVSRLEKAIGILLEENQVPE